MNEFLTAKEISSLCHVKLTKAYLIIKQLNTELENKVFLIINRKINKRYFLERFYLESK